MFWAKSSRDSKRPHCTHLTPPSPSQQNCPHCHKSPRLINNVSTCGQVDMIFIGPTTSKETPTHSCVMYNIVPCYMCTLVLQHRPTTANNAKREEWLILLCTYLLSHRRHAPISDSTPHSTHLPGDRVLSLQCTLHLLPHLIHS